MSKSADRVADIKFADNADFLVWQNAIAPWLFRVDTDSIAGRDL
jgi:hypothetical protein